MDHNANQNQAPHSVDFKTWWRAHLPHEKLSCIVIAAVIVAYICASIFINDSEGIRHVYYPIYVLAFIAQSLWWIFALIIAGFVLSKTASVHRLWRRLRIYFSKWN